MIKRRITWLLMTGLMVWSGVYGLFYGLEWAKNIFLFLAWASVILTTLCAFNKDARLASQAKGRSVPAWLSMGIDLAIVVALASVGHFVLATGMLLQVMFEHSIMGGEG